MQLAAGSMTDAEWAVRVELALCYRLVAHYGLTDQIYTHISARVPGAPGHFLLNPLGWRFDEITASSLVKIDLDGRSVEDGSEAVNPAGFTIHSAVMMARDDVACVLHLHSRAGMAVAALDCGLLPVNQISMQFHDRLAYHDYEGVSLHLDERARLIADLGDKRAMILRNHGLLTAARSVTEAFSRAYYLETACQVQLDAMKSGAGLRLPPPEVCEHAARQYDDFFEKDGPALEWQANRRLIDKVNPGYAA
ncbi:MAG: class II aldolase/adducin family protein [Rhodospirillales bacterium]|nr:class II aldolase/adducin family protein [Rhodospirillales bacterium]